MSSRELNARRWKSREVRKLCAGGLARAMIFSKHGAGVADSGKRDNSTATEKGLAVDREVRGTLWAKGCVACGGPVGDA